MTATALWLAGMMAAFCSTDAPARPGPAVPTPVARCADWLDASHAMSHEPAVTTALSDGGCRFERVRFDVSPSFGYELETLEAHGIAFDLTREDGPPMSLRIEARGIRSARSDVGSAEAWVWRQRQTPFNVTFDATLDPAARVLTVREASITGEEVGLAELDAGVVLITSPGSAAGAPFGFRSLHLDLDSRTAVAQFIAPVLGYFIVARGPNESLGQDKLVAASFLRDALPRTGATPATVDAFVGFVADIPRPTHPFQLTLTVPGGLVTPDDVGRAGDTPDGLTALLKKLRVEATYQGPITLETLP